MGWFPQMELRKISCPATPGWYSHPSSDKASVLGKEGPLAQRIRAADYGSAGHRFESYRAHFCFLEAIRKFVKSLFAPHQLRRTILEMAYAGSSNHIACAFSMVEILSTLYRYHLRLGAAPGDPARDILIVSKGHGVMAQYACLFEMGWLKREALENYLKDGTELMGECDAHVPGLEVSSGSLGHGFNVGLGMALAIKRRGEDRQVYVILGDGECDEGSIWEGFLFAAQQKLSNLLVIVDANGFQGLGRTDDILSLRSLHERLAAFGFETWCVGGHDVAALSEAVAQVRASAHSGPRAIIARTIKGYGVSFMQDTNAWHYNVLDEETFAAARREVSVNAREEAEGAGRHP
jgi:transketolase